MGLLGGQAIEMALSVVLASASVRLFGVETIGQVSLVFATIGIASALANLGFGNYFIKSIAQRQSLSEHLSAFTLLQGLSLILFLLAAAGIAWWGEAGPRFIILLAIIYYIVFSVGELFSTLFAAKQEYIRSSLQRIVGLIGRLLALLVIGWLGPTLTGFALLAVIEVIIQVTVAIPYVIAYRPRLVPVTKQLLARYFHYTLPFLPSTITSRFFIHFDKVITGYFFDPLTVGLLVMSQALFSPFDAVIKTITGTSFPKIVQDSVALPAEHKEQFRNLVYFHVLVGGILAIFLVAWADTAVRIVFGTPYPLVVQTGSLFVIVIFGKMLLRPYASLLMSLEAHHFYQYVISLVHPILKLVLYLLLIPRLGILAIPIVTGGLWFILILPLTYVCLRTLGDLYYLKEGIILVGTAFLALGSGHVATWYVGDFIWLQAIVQTVISLVVFSVGAYWLGALKMVTWHNLYQTVDQFGFFIRQELERK
jgi:O-antigen/teichoic acid export membrane protein